ncbi:bifunctional dihydrofolate reductase/thymidylate synthase, partial [Skeletonema marinoi]
LSFFLIGSPTTHPTNTSLEIRRCISYTTIKTRLDTAFQIMTDVAAVVAAAAGSRGIGFQGKLPWRLPGDMNHFKQVTSTPPSPDRINAVIMGRKTWDSIPSKFRPLDGRVNVILSRKGAEGVEGAEGNKFVLVAKSMEEAMEQLKSRPDHGTTFIIGGGEIYNQAMTSGLVKRVVYTNVRAYQKIPNLMPSFLK